MCFNSNFNQCNTGCYYPCPICTGWQRVRALLNNYSPNIIVTPISVFNF